MDHFSFRLIFFHCIRNNALRHVRGLAQGVVPQMGPLGHLRALVCQKLLERVHVHFAGTGQHGGIGVAQAMKRAETLREARSFLDAINWTTHISPLPSSLSGKHIRAGCPFMGQKNILSGVIHRDLLGDAALGGVEQNELALEIDVLPLQAEEFASPHAGKQSEFHHPAHIDAQIVVDDFDERFQLIIGNIFGVDVVDMRSLDI